MRKPEQRLWQYVRKGMAGRWHAQRHEDMLSAGIPDVSYAIDGVDGWIELKAIDRWPARDATPVRVGIRPAQVRWLSLRGQHGHGHCYVLLAVGRGAKAEFVLVGWRDVPRLSTDTLTRVDIVGGGLPTAHRWIGSIDWQSFSYAISRRAGRPGVRGEYA